MHFQELATSARNTDTLRKNVGVRVLEEQRSLNVRSVKRNIMDSVGHGAAHHPTKTHRKEDGKATEKETAREPESSKEEKAETKGKEKLCENHGSIYHWTGGQKPHLTQKGKTINWQLTKVRNKNEVIAEARVIGGPLSSQEFGIGTTISKYKGRVVLRRDIVKDAPGSCAVFTEEGSSASHLTAAKVMY